MTKWFEVDTEGLKALQAGKSKTFIVRELVQNAWDENISSCSIDISHEDSTIKIKMEDDSPEGFKDLTHAYTLYSDTYKRKDVTKRGRFNLGDKQVFAVCNRIKLWTTKGLIVFDADGRHESKKFDKKRGTIIDLELDGTAEEAKEMELYAKSLFVPEGIKYIVNNYPVASVKPDKIFEARLDTEADVDGVFKKTNRKTEVQVIESPEGNSLLFEMGLPVCEIDCDYSINVMQKIPLGMDRETVSQPYLRQLFAHVLNHTHESIDEDSASNSWIRLALTDKHIPIAEAVKNVISKRFGDKACTFTATDPNSADEAISRGYNVIHGSEMSKGEWENVRKHDALQSSHELFGTESFSTAEDYEPNSNDKLGAEYAKAIAKEVFGLNIDVIFITAKGTSVAADFSREQNLLRFNMGVLGKNYFKNPVSEEPTRLIIHELGHIRGNHTESEYHDAICRIGARLTMKALKDSKFFNRFGGA